jgi:hypothetical protein
MTFQGVPWAVGGGAENPPEAARLLAYIAARTERGVVLPADCAVMATAVPSGQVRVVSGGVVIPNGKTVAETYFGRNPEDHVVTITPTDAGGGRSDLVYVRIADPQYVDEPAPASVPDGPYNTVEVIAGVSPTTKTLADAIAQGLAPVGRTGLELARVTLPASTGTVTQGMITDLRRVANPRRTREQFTAAGSSQNLTNAGYVTFPSTATWSVDVPAWATHAVVHFVAGGVRFNTDNVIGYMRAAIGSVVGQGVAYDMQSPTGVSRGDVHAADTVAIPDALRGTTQTVKAQGYRSSGTGYLQSFTSTICVMDVEFFEQVG